MTVRKKESILAKLVAEPIYRQIRYSTIAEKGREIRTLQVSLFNKERMRHEYKFPLKDIKSLEQDEEKMTIILKDDTIFYLSHKDFIFKGIGKFLLAIPKKVK